ncbi:MAG TPA: fumarate hydratase [Sphaerochaeta sp.]|nr:fumarate hydratase [Sphaerochaeta sp.]HQB05283.1 fumarate hydratase [Sphaerochaeta sp.]
MSLAKRIEKALIDAARILHEPIHKRLEWAREEEERLDGKSVGSKASIAVLEAILENLRISRNEWIPMCQDTGMFDVFVDVGRSCPLSHAEIEEAILTGCEEGAKNGYFRPSVVEEPLFGRKNTKTNTPPIIWWNLVEGRNVEINILLKGFGSENTCATRMMNPTATEEQIVAAVAEIVTIAGGKPCPPIFLGIGLGGTMERAAYLSKRALLREVGVPHSVERYAKLEEKILAGVQATGVGAGGLGGKITALNVAIEYEPTHIAGLPMGVSINCWADRIAHIVWEG